MDLKNGDVSHIKEGLIQLFGTPKGTRFFRRDFGDTVEDLLFRPNSPHEVAMWYSEREDVLRRWEPRVILSNIEITLQREHYLAFRLSFFVDGVNVSEEIGLGTGLVT